MNQHLSQVRGFRFSLNFMKFLFLTAIFFLLLTEPALSIDKLFGTCVPQSCGKGPNISFPFWIPDKHPPYCGYPGFKLTCKNQEPILEIFSSKYIIQDIFYERQSLSIVKEGWIDKKYCPHPLYNVTFNYTSFHIDESNLNLLVFYNCTQEQLPQYQPIPCISNQTHHAFARLSFTGSLMNSSNFPKKCQSYASVPVMMDSKPQDNYLEMIHRGFLLNWTSPSCSRCSESGGQCGYVENEFKCFCRDRPHLVSCKNRLVSDIAGVDKRKRMKLIVVNFIRKLPPDHSIFFWRKKTNDSHNVETFLERYGALVPRRYRYSELKKMTNSFKDNLGQGGYGSVFKGKFNDGRLVAVKVLNNSKGGNGEEFINEVASIGRTYHVNVVALLGFCSEGSKRALIYEFMPRGSLEKFIYPDKLGVSHALDCQKLFQIAVGIARGLEYLHGGCSIRILHLDMKPHNVLLDDDFCPKISDFGLAKLCPKRESTVSMHVYSYGMMVLEMIGGRKNTDAGAENTSEIYFPHWIYKQILLEESLGLLGFKTEAEEEIARKIVIVGLWCIQTDPTNRPSMSKVVEMLEERLGRLQMPPKPYFSSPLRSFSSTT